MYSLPDVELRVKCHLIVCKGNWKTIMTVCMVMKKYFIPPQILAENFSIILQRENLN